MKKVLMTKYKMNKYPNVILTDCDLYSSTKTVLNFLKPILRMVSIVIFDD
jgi:hypothetical protein